MPGADLKDPMQGTCRDGSGVRARCIVGYQLPVSHVFGSRLEQLQERLATRIMARIFDAEDPVCLGMQRSQIEAELLLLAQKPMPTVKQVKVEFSPV